MPFIRHARCAARISIALVVATASAAHAASLYKLIDAQGRVTYASSPPKGFDGKVVPLEVATGTDQGVRFGPPQDEAPEQKRDYLAERRARWSLVETRLREARDWLAEARETLANAAPGEGDVIWVAKQTPQTNPGVPKPYESPMVKGDTQMCVETFRAGKRVKACGRRALSDDYAARLEYLQDQVRQAELAVSEAEIAYRRNVD